MLGTIFYEERCPCDGAVVVIRDSVIVAAGCVLSNNLEMGKDMAPPPPRRLGAGENSDAIVVIVSEGPASSRWRRTACSSAAWTARTSSNLLQEDRSPAEDGRPISRRCKSCCAKEEH